MNCHETRRWIAAHLDGELDLALDAEVTAHLQACPECAELARRERELAGIVREKLPRYAPPPHLATRIRAHVGGSQSLGSRPPVRGLFRWPAWPVVGALAAVGVALVTGYGWGARHEQGALFGEELVADHVRAQMTDHLIDVVSSDRHTVKPWLAGRLDFSPPVADLAAGGFPLLGGRIDQIGGRPAAALVYRRGRHVITVYVWPAQTPLPFDQSRRLGYALRAWRAGDLNFAAVSDVAADDFNDFVAQFRAIH